MLRSLTSPTHLAVFLASCLLQIASGADDSSHNRASISRTFDIRDFRLDTDDPQEMSAAINRATQACSDAESSRQV